MTDSGRVPLEPGVVLAAAAELGLDVARASIREMNHLVNAIEERSGVRFVRMEFGIPGLALSPIAIEAEREALERVGHVYAPFSGVSELKEEASRFARLFLDLDLPPTSCVPTVGAMQGCFASILLASHLRRDARTVLCLEPGFPVNKLQLRVLGLRTAQIDFYDHRGDVLIRAVEERARQGDLCALLWSSPNNPSWIVLDERELAGLGRICSEHGLLAIEDLAYFGMDTRQNYLVPGEPPYQPTVLRYTDHAISILSSSKMFSYAGQRVALAFFPPRLLSLEAPELVEHFGTSRVGHAFMHGALYPVTASVPQSPQYGLAALLRAVNAGDQSPWAPAREYSRRARMLKAMFLSHGFRLVYDNDLGQPLADGFYFTIAHPAFRDGADLLFELLRYGVSAIPLALSGSCRTEGLRACVSLTGDAELALLEPRLDAFRRDHPALEGPRAQAERPR